jgi:pyruvate ferredoxin oxidoreductase gamma subunit
VANRALVIVNSGRTAEELGLASLALGLRRLRLVTLPATEIARKHVGRAVPNVPLLGAFAALSGVIGLPSLVRAIGEKFPAAIAERNIAAANEAYALAQAAAEDVHA